MSKGIELSDPNRRYVVGDWMDSGMRAVNRDDALRERFKAAGVDTVDATFILGDEDWSEPRRTRYRLQGSTLDVTGWRLDPGSTGEQFEAWFGGAAARPIGGLEAPAEDGRQLRMSSLTASDTRLNMSTDTTRSRPTSCSTDCSTTSSPPAGFVPAG